MLSCEVQLDTNVHPFNEKRSDDIDEKMIADSGTSFHMTHSADILSDV